MKAFLDELKRRNVIRVGGIYLVAGWILMQAAALLEDALPDVCETEDVPFCRELKAAAMP